MTPDAGLLWTYWIGSAVLWLGLSVLVVRRWRLPQQSAPWLILGLGILLRLGYVTLPPTLSDDIWRYVHDGRVLASGQNPYEHTPAEHLAAAPPPTLQASTQGTAQTDWRTRINHPELHTIYQPTSLWTFAAVTHVTDLVTAGPQASGEAVARALRLLWIVCDALIILLIMRQLKQLGRSAWWAVMYAWSPLAITESAWSGHQESLGILLMLCTLVLAQEADKGWRSWRSWRATVLAGVAGGLTIGFKPIVIPLAWPLMWKLRGEPRAMGRMIVASLSCLVTLVALYLPLMLMHGGLAGLFETGRTFVSTWRFNGSLHPLVEYLVLEAHGTLPWASAKLIADVICGGLLMAVLVAATVLHRVPWRAATTFLFAAVCLTSTAHPWYLLWALALIPASWSAARTVVAPGVWVASLTLPWAYVAWLELGAGRAFEVPLGWRLAIWLPIYAAVAWGAVVVVRSLRHPEWRPLGGRG